MMKWQIMDFEIIIFLIVIIFIPGTNGFLWSLLGLDCHCCGCNSAPQVPSYHTFSHSPSYQSNYIHSPPHQPHYNKHLDHYVQPPPFNPHHYQHQPKHHYSSHPMDLHRVMPEELYQEPPQYYAQALRQESEALDFPMRTLLPPVDNYPERMQQTLQGSASIDRGPPSASPMSREELQLDDGDNTRQYSTGDNIVDVQVGSEDEALNMLVNELAEEKYKYNQQKNEEHTKTIPKQKQQRIKTFRIRPIKHHHEIHAGKIEWQGSQIPRYSHEKVDKNNKNTLTTTHEQTLDTFIPIEVGKEPEFASEEPAGAPPNVKPFMKLDLDSSSAFRRRFVN